MPDPILDSVTLEDVAAEVASLRDLLQRRLLEDRAKGRLYDELHEQVEFARRELGRIYLRPLYAELLLVIDRLRQMDEEPQTASALEELEEVLRRRDVRRAPEPEWFDPAHHEAVQTEHSESTPSGAVVSVLRNGYLMGDEVLRPALVVVSSGPGRSMPSGSPAEAAESADD